MIQAVLKTGSTRTCAFQAPPKPTRRIKNGLATAFILQLILGVLILGMVAALILSTTTSSFGQDPAKAMALVLGLVTVLSFFGLQGMSSQRLPTAVWVLLACITLAGIPGIALNPTAAMENGVPFLILLIIRNYVCFFAIPLSLPAKRSLLERSLCKWALACVAIMAVGTLLAANRAGISLATATRLTGADNAWINMNTVALYCSYGILVCAMATFLPRLLRFAIAVPVLYALTLTQSRTAFLSLFLSLAVHFALSYRRRKVVGIAIATTGLLLIGAFFGNVAPFLRSVPQLSAITDRFQGQAERGDDMRAGIIQHGLDTWSQAPIFGHGLNSGVSRFENGYLSLACESGALGLFLYLLFLALVFMQIRRLIRTTESSRSYTIGKYLLCTTVFVVVHGMGERSHGFQLGSAVSNIWAILVALAYVVPLSAPNAARKGIPWYFRSSGDQAQLCAPLRISTGARGPVR